METIVYCQSCGMPLGQPELCGTEKDGSVNNIYCRFCYSNGRFTKSDITLATMRSFVIEKMKEEKMDPDFIEALIARLPQLKRWKKESAISVPERPLVAGQAILPEKHPLEKPPTTENIIISEDELDKITDDEMEEALPFDSPEPGEGP